MVAKLVCLIITLTLAAPVAVASAQVIAPVVPGNLEVPSGQPFLIAHADGTQGYTCVVSPGGFAWSFFGPQATLFNDGDQQITTHYLSANPDEAGALRATWRHSADTRTCLGRRDREFCGSGVRGAGRHPWLLLRVVGTEEGPTGGATLSGAIYIQRVNTRAARRQQPDARRHRTLASERSCLTPPTTCSIDKRRPLQRLTVPASPPRTIWVSGTEEEAGVGDVSEQLSEAPNLECRFEGVFLRRHACRRLCQVLPNGGVHRSSRRRHRWRERVAEPGTRGLAESWPRGA